MRTDHEPHELPLERDHARVGDRVAQRHVRRPAVAAEDRDVGERGLKPTGHQPAGGRQLVRDVLGDDQVTRRDARGVEQAAHDAQVAVRGARNERLIAHVRHHLVAVDGGERDGSGALDL